MVSKQVTNLEQSRKLVKILPLNSADRSWTMVYDENNYYVLDYKLEYKLNKLASYMGVPSLPAWSFLALLKILPKEIDTNILTIQPSLSSKNWVIGYFNKVDPNISLCSFEGKNLIDICVDLIVSLKNKKIL